MLEEYLPFFFWFLVHEDEEISTSVFDFSQNLLSIVCIPHDITFFHSEG